MRSVIFVQARQSVKNKPSENTCFQLTMEYVHNIDFENVTTKEILGTGSFGVVYKAVWREKTVAMKKFQEMQGIENEVVQLSRARHPNIIELYGITSDEQGHKCLIMEYAENGSLDKRIHDNQRDYSIEQALDWAFQCAEGIAYLHNQTTPILHRDLKPLNLLLTDQERQLKICDFGLVTILRSRGMTTDTGTPCYMAPEVFEGGNYSKKCDVFSLGVILWELLKKERPYNHLKDGYVILYQIKNGHRPQLPSEWPEVIKKLITSCWAQEPADRPSMDEVVSQIRRIKENRSRANDSDDEQRSAPTSAGFNDTMIPKPKEMQRPAPTSRGCYERPRSQIDLLPVRGFTVSVPDMPGIELFAFHGKLNEEMDGLEGGTWSRDIIKAKNGRWTYTNNDVQLKSGDKIFYWTMIHYNGLGYREDDCVFEVNSHA